MSEFMLLIRNGIDHESTWSHEKHQQFLKSCENYIAKLKKDGKLKTAQPLVREGVIISSSNGKWKEIPFNENKEVQVGYYHIFARDMREAIEIAKGNPEFEYGTTARIEVRPIKTREETTNYVYPTKAGYNVFPAIPDSNHSAREGGKKRTPQPSGSRASISPYCSKRYMASELIVDV